MRSDPTAGAAGLGAFREGRRSSGRGLAGAFLQNAGRVVGDPAFLRSADASFASALPCDVRLVVENAGRPAVAADGNCRCDFHPEPNVRASFRKDVASLAGLAFQRSAGDHPASVHPCGALLVVHSRGRLVAVAGRSPCGGADAGDPFHIAGRCHRSLATCGAGGGDVQSYAHRLGHVAPMAVGQLAIDGGGLRAGLAVAAVVGRSCADGRRAVRFVRGRKTDAPRAASADLRRVGRNCRRRDSGVLHFAGVGFLEDDHFDGGDPRAELRREVLPGFGPDLLRRGDDVDDEVFLHRGALRFRCVVDLHRMADSVAGCLVHRASRSKEGPRLLR